MKALTSLIVTASLVAGGATVWKTCGTAFAQPNPSAAVAVVALPASKSAPVVEIKSVEAAPVVTDTAVVAKDAAKEEKAADKPAGAETQITFAETDLMTSIQQGVLQATLRGNGKERMSAQLRNNSANPVRVQIPAGQVLESGRNSVVVLRAVDVELTPAQSVEVALTTASLHTSNKVGEGTYKLSYQTAPKVEAFLKWLASHPEIAIPTAQTAVLALTENLPLNSVAKFAPVTGVRSRFNTDSFRVETSDIIAALTALRESGVRPETLAMSVDPQLKIEAMIEPLSREIAKRFYGIAEEREWDFWRNELLNGDPSTRHYALFGIARFYPEIALDMLPRWARESKTHPVYRMSAIQALADTQRPDALPVLRQLSDELGTESELGKAAAQAAGYLDSRLTQLAAILPITFRPILEHAAGM